MRRKGAVITAAVFILAALGAGPAIACILDLFVNSYPPKYGFLFPNWRRAEVTVFDTEWCGSGACPGATDGTFRGVTLVNYGTATGGLGGDITGVYMCFYCTRSTADCSPAQTLAYVGLWGGQHVWTWSGSVTLDDDPCSGGPGHCATCGGVEKLLMKVFVDISPCPTNLATVQLGPRVDFALNPTWGGGVTDADGCAVPYGEVYDRVAKPIVYTTKESDRESAAPGDTISYTLYYGRPGTAATLSNVWITDTQPAYTHLLAGTANPNPDPGWDPKIGPPQVLRWTFASLPVAGGATGRITFALTVDWGNGDTFEAGSGNVAAPEGIFLFNTAHMSWEPSTGCTSPRTSNTLSTSVRRYTFWKLGDNDVLFAGRVGAPDDEMIYSIFMRNESQLKTWWDVRVWDTVPPELDVWTPGYGMEDPCIGWTMTPSGCAAASPGPLLSGTDTILTWRLDMPPWMTLTVRWKARVKPSVPWGVTCLNRASIMELGRTRIVEGTGHAGRVRVFTHEAPVVLRTTYISYVGYSAMSADYYNACPGDWTYFLSFYPLNRATNFALYKRWCCSAAPCDAACAGFAQDGGVSPPINMMAGTCIGGPGTDWETGCMSERSPARFVPSAMWDSAYPAFPYNLLHKLVSNSPVIWEFSTCLSANNQESITYAGMTSLSFCGYMGYTWVRSAIPPNVLDTLYIVNTDETTPTTVHLFRWNAPALSWDHITTKDIFNESEWAYVHAADDHIRIVSSDARLVVHKAYHGIGNGVGDTNEGALAPTRENGNLVNDTPPANFYVFAGRAPELAMCDLVVIGNVGGAQASYEIYGYNPTDPTAPSPNTQVTPRLVGNSGYWTLMGTGTVDPGQTAAANPHAYGPDYDTTPFTGTLRLYKVKVLSGGPIQVFAGRHIFTGYGSGGMLHSANPPGAQTGREFWVHETYADTGVKGESCGGNNMSIMTINIYSPKSGLAVRNTSNDGYSATYTTNDADECISFKALTGPAQGARRNWKASVLAGGNPGDVIAQYLSCQVLEKFYAAPFLRRGTYYDIIVPPVVYVGQSFWITVVVMDSGGGTKTDYCGTTSFTSTDPGAKIQGSVMDAYNFTWSSSLTCPGANENGVKIFMNVSMTRLGLQTIVATDTIDGSIVGVGVIMVVGADIKLEKRRKLTVAASGDTVQFQLCWSNYSSATGFSFTITDAVPMGTSYVPEIASTMLCGTSGPVPGVVVWYSTATSTTPPGTFTSVPGTGSPLSNTRWLRWTIRDAYVNSSGCVCFKVSVN